MKERHVLFGAVFVLAFAVIINLAPKANAITPTGPGLYDGNGVYLGQLLSTNYGLSGLTQRTAITYTTYLPAVDGILQFSTNTGRLFANTPENIYFSQPDCIGTAYVDTTAEPWIQPWIVGTTDGTTFKVASSTLQNISTQSSLLGSQSNNCENNSRTLDTAHKLKPVTLPFDVNSVTVPFKITAM